MKQSLKLGNWVRVTLLYLLLVTIFGMLLRYTFVNPLGFVFQYFKHTHSHVAFLGWVFNGLFVLIIGHYFTEITKTVKWQFYLFQVSVIGMLLSFPFQGYTAVSIAFSTLHIFISIWFYFSTLTKIQGSDISIKWIKMGAFYMVISNIGPLSLGPIMASHLKDTFVYYLSLQHYLHFQYNGWFVVAIIGLLIKIFDLKLKNEKLLFWLLGWSVIPLFFVTIEIIESNPIYRIIGGAGAIAQLLGVVILLIELFQTFVKQNIIYKIIFFVASICLLVKSLFQVAVVFPSISSMIIHAHNPVIGFLHLIFLGVITNGVIALFMKSGFIKLDRTTLLGVILFNSGFILMDLLLFIQPFYTPDHYFHWLFYSTIPIFGGVLIYNMQGWRNI